MVSRRHGDISSKTGRQIIQAIIDGHLPQAPISETLSFWIVEVGSPEPDTKLMTRKRSSASAKRLRVKRIYEPADDSDGLRLLVDRLWPRGLAKEKARIDAWLKDIAPSHELRRRFHAKPQLWAEFKTAYAAELAQEPARAEVARLRDQLAKGVVTLLYAASDEEHNNAVALRDWLMARSR